MHIQLRKKGRQTQGQNSLQYEDLLMQNLENVSDFPVISHEYESFYGNRNFLICC